MEINKSKWAIMRDFLKGEIQDIFNGSPYDSVKENVFFQDEYPDNNRPDELQSYILVNFEQQGNNVRGYYLYTMTFSFIYNGVSKMSEISAMEDYFDIKFEDRLKLQNKYGLWFAEPLKVGLNKTDDGVKTKTILTSSYTMRVYFK